ncbi:hypothetical protein GOBAR_AA05970 [Gossypium barbadense]|uniref:YTH domain-containing family protein n=1 Tax=Gossypium barbadense TaxID=3634 RepID=A0A2P5YG96_GOSBA|nr:hypothetical protein GOBAR_AA05970 [Gossypium barbadense]
MAPTVAPPADQTAELLQKLTIDSQAKPFDIPEPTKKSSVYQYGSVDSGNTGNTQIPTFDRSTTPLLQDFMDPTMCYIPSGYPSAYYYGGFDGTGNEWDEYSQYLNPDGVDMTSGVYGDNGSLMYHHGYSYAPYGPYSPAASPVPTLGNDGQLYGPQHYQYPPFFQPMTLNSGPFTPNPAAPSHGELLTSAAADQKPFNNKYRPRGRGNGYFGSGNDIMDGFNELNRGPRAKGPKSQKGATAITASTKGQNIPSDGTKDEEKAYVVPDREQYNLVEFPVDYDDAKFFVIKSYSEDDVHKSIKYNVWASTPNGNKKLDAAYQEAQQKSGHCPIFLFFSVNTSGQFVGIAEMVGAVDFQKNVEFWQQDKWTGCFPVRWLIIKDVPNNSLKHITLENNENKPVTNSRDTQELKAPPKLSSLKTAALHNRDSFYVWEEKPGDEKKDIATTNGDLIKEANPIPHSNGLLSEDGSGYPKQ